MDSQKQRKYKGFEAFENQKISRVDQKYTILSQQPK